MTAANSSYPVNVLTLQIGYLTSTSQFMKFFALRNFHKHIWVLQSLMHLMVLTKIAYIVYEVSYGK